MPVVAGRRDAHGSRRVGHDGRHSHLQVKEGAEGVIGIVDLIKELFEWEEVSTLEHDVGAAGLRAVIGHQLFDGGPIVIVVEEGVARVLLPVERDREGDGLLNDV